MSIEWIATRDGEPFGIYRRSDEGSWQWEGEPGMPHLYGRVASGPERQTILWGLELPEDADWTEEFSRTWAALDDDGVELVPVPSYGSVFVPLKRDSPLPMGTVVAFTPDGAAVDGEPIDGAPKSLHILLDRLGLEVAVGRVIAPDDSSSRITVVRLSHWVAEVASR